jgi:peptide/nickel transport system substrate-binding protein
VPKFVAAPSIETAMVRPDTQNPVLKDKRVRMAMNLAIDKQLLVDKLLGGFGDVPKGQLVGDYVLGFNPDLKPYPGDS